MFMTQNYLLWTKMKKAIIVSGCVGTGKSKIAKKISKEKNYKYVDITKLIKKYNLSYNWIRSCRGMVWLEMVAEKETTLINRNSDKFTADFW